MEVKKTPKADLENKKSTWLLVGYVIVLAFMFVAFEWTKRDVKIDMSQAVTDVVFEEEIEIPITEQPEMATPPPPPEAPAIAETLTIVEDDAEVEETVIASTEDTGQAVEIKYVPVEVEEEEPEEQTIFEVVEQMPEFPNGGMAGLMQFLSKNIKYPTIAQENGTQGRVTVQFVVNKDGSIVDAKVLRGVDPYLDKEALRVIGTMPKWKPGMQRGKVVRVKFTVPVTFQLTEGQATDGAAQEVSEGPTIHLKSGDVKALGMQLGRSGSVDPAAKDLPLVKVDGKTVSYEEMKAIDSKRIDYISVIKNAEAVKQYGAEAKHGVILITLKK